jgi:hypothetical protein
VLKYVHNGTLSLHGGQTLSYTVSGAVTKGKVGVGMTFSFVLWRKSEIEVYLQKSHYCPPEGRINTVKIKHNTLFCKIFGHLAFINAMEMTIL